MAFSDVIDTLRNEEEQLAKQLSNIRAALTALGSNIPYIATGRGRKPGRLVGSKNASEGVAEPRKRRTMSAKARKAISDAQKKRWAKQKAAQNK